MRDIEDAFGHAAYDYAHGNTGVVEIVEVEADEGQLRSVMSAGEGAGATDLLPPVSSQTRGLVNMAMECEQRLAILDEALNGDAPDVDVEHPPSRPPSS